MLIGDFETTTGISYNLTGKLRVYMYALKDYDTEKIVNSGTSVEEFINYVMGLRKSQDIYFHNGGGFDYHFIIKILLDRFELVENITAPYQMSVLMKSNKSFLQITINVGTEKKPIYIRFKDSYLLISLSVKTLGEKMGMNKGDISTYHIDPTWNNIVECITDDKLPSKYLPEYYEYNGTKLYTKGINGKIMWDYMIRDIDIIIKSMKELNEKLPKQYWKLTLSQSLYSWWYNELPKHIQSGLEMSIEDWTALSKWYRGGLTLPKRNNTYKVHKNVSVYDINSMYPSIMRNIDMPIGKVIKGHGGKFKLYRVWVKKVRCRDDRQPFIPKKDLTSEYTKGTVLYNIITTYPIELKNQHIYLTDIELELFYDTYEGRIGTPKIMYSFNTIKGLYKDYIDFWMNHKIQDEKNGNMIGREIDKLCMNTQYGKAAQKPVIKGKCIKKYDINVNLTHNDIMIGDEWYITTAEEVEGKPKYIPIAIAITANARVQLLTMINLYWWWFLYGDTDSLHITCFMDEIYIHNSKLGMWKYEGTYEEAIYREAKQYYLHKNLKDGSDKIVVAGVVKRHNKEVPFSEFTNDTITYKYGSNVKVYTGDGLFFYNDTKTLTRQNRREK